MPCHVAAPREVTCPAHVSRSPSLPPLLAAFVECSATRRMVVGYPIGLHRRGQLKLNRRHVVGGENSLARTQKRFFSLSLFEINTSWGILHRRENSHASSLRPVRRSLSDCTAVHRLKLNPRRVVGGENSRAEKRIFLSLF